MSLLTTPEVAEVVGITYRQLDSWVRAGYLPMAGQGSGFTRRWDRHQIEQVGYLAALVRAGIEPRRAARLMVSGCPPGPVTITLDTDAVGEAIAAAVTHNLREKQDPMTPPIMTTEPTEGNPR